MPSGNSQPSAAPFQGSRQERPRGILAGLLAVAFQNLVARFGQLGAIVFEAGQDDEIGLIHDRATELLHIMSAGFLLLRRAAM